MQAVCDRIVIINKGKIVANEKTENISHVVENTRRFNVKIAGPQKDILAMLRDMQGISYAEVLAERDGDAYTYMIESEYGVDIRKKLFFTLAERGWAMIGMESLGLSLEDIFISVVDKSDRVGTREAASSGARRSAKAKTRGSLESELAGAMLEESRERREALSKQAPVEAED